MRHFARLALLLLGAFLARRLTPQTAPRTSDVSPVEPLGYDIRRGAAAYAPIIGAISGFVVPTVVLIFEIASDPGNAADDVALGRSTALLVLGLIACMLGAFAFAAIGGERRLTANLNAAALCAGAASVIGIVAIIAAFEALSQAFLPATNDLFVWITTGTAIGGTVFVAMTLGDAWVSAPNGHWLSKRSVGYRWTSFVSGLAAAILLGDTVLYFAEVRVSITETEMHWLVGGGIALALLGGLGSLFRAMHGPSDGEWALGKWEAFVVLGALVSYLAALILVMPYGYPRCNGHADLPPDLIESASSQAEESPLTNKRFGIRYQRRAC